MKRNVVVTAGRETVVEFTPSSAVTEPPSESTPVRTRKIIGGISMGIGAILGAVAVYEAINWSSLQSDGDAYAATIARPADNKPCAQYDVRCIDIDKDAKTASALAWTLGGVGVVAIGVGAYLFFTDSGSSEAPKTAAAPKPKARIVPQVGSTSGGLMVLGSF